MPFNPLLMQTFSPKNRPLLRQVMPHFGTQASGRTPAARCVLNQDQRDAVALSVRDRLAGLAENRQDRGLPAFQSQVWRFSPAAASPVVSFHASSPQGGQSEADLTALLNEAMREPVRQAYAKALGRAPETLIPGVRVKFHAPDEYKQPGRETMGCCLLRKLEQKGVDSVVKECEIGQARNGAEHRDVCGGCAADHEAQIPEAMRKQHYHPRNVELKPVNLFA